MQSSTTLTPTSVVEEARKWLGTRWRHQGRNKHGIDCAGLVIKVANDLELSTFDTRNYARGTSGDPFVHYFTGAGMVEVQIEDVKEGDVVLTEDTNFPCHCGFVSTKRGQLHFVHAYAQRKKVVEEPLSHWLNRHKVSHVLRFPEFC